MIIKRIIDQLIQKKSITCVEAEQVMQSALNGGATPAQISAFFTSILMKGITYIEFEGMLKGIKHKEVHDYKQNIDFYVYSFTQSNIVFSICFLLSQLNYSLCGKFKNLYSENTEFFNTDDAVNVSNEQKVLLLDKFRLHLSLSDYNKILKNILFLRTELNLAQILALFEMSIIPIKDTKQVILVDEKNFQQLQSISNLHNLFADKLIIVMSTHEIKLLRMKRYELFREKIIKLHNLENYHYLPFISAAKNENFIHATCIVVKEILALFGLENKLSNDKKKEFSKKILLSFMDYFKEIKDWEQH